jgi:flagellar FliL protein
LKRVAGCDAKLEISKVIRTGTILAMLCVAMFAGAEGTESGGVKYVTLQPAFVTNYGVTKTGRLTYLKADVTLKVADAEGEAALKYHTPALRNALVLLFSRQEDTVVSSSEGREQIRQEALTALRDIMQTEEGAQVIEDLVFSNFVVQH